MCVVHKCGSECGADRLNVQYGSGGDDAFGQTDIGIGHDYCFIRDWVVARTIYWRCHAIH